MDLMQIDTQSYQLPQYQSTLLKKQKEHKNIASKVTHICPEIKDTQKFKIKKHHLDDTEVRLALQYDYDDCHQPRQFAFKGDRVQYDKNDYQSKYEKKQKLAQSSPKFNTTGFSIANTAPNYISNNNDQPSLKINSDYFQIRPNINTFIKPQRDISFTESKDNSKQKLKTDYESQKTEPRQKKALSKIKTDYESQKVEPIQKKVLSKLKTDYESQNVEPRQKKALSTYQFDNLRKNQEAMQNKVLQKLSALQHQSQELKMYLKNKQNKQKSSPKQPEIIRYKSQSKSTSVQKDFKKLKEKLQKQRLKQKQRLANELKKIKQEGKKMKELQKMRKKSFKQLLQKQQNQYQQTIQKVVNYSSNRYLDNLALNKGESNNNEGKVNNEAVRVKIRSSNNGVSNKSGNGAISSPAIKTIGDLNNNHQKNDFSEKYRIQLLQTKQHLQRLQKIENQQQQLMIRQKLNQLQNKYLPKLNVVNKRIQCEIYDPKSDHFNKLKSKPQFLYNQQSDTDSQFSDY